MMRDLINGLPYRKEILALIIILIFASSAFEITSEFLDGQNITDMSDDIVWFVLSAGMLGFFLFEHRHQKHHIKELREQLGQAHSQLSKIDSQTKEVANQYRAIMQKQFDAWQLTASEQDIVILMLKGLSFQDIADLRETREKTVRSQASTIYKKAGLANRHELAAWFFEDLLDHPS